jgi:hypothetical protein
MNSSMIWVFVAFAVLCVSVFLVVEGQRRQSVERVAETMGLSFTGGQHRLPDAIDQAGFYLFTQGQPLILNGLDGVRSGYQVSLFDFAYDAGKGEEGSRDLMPADVGQQERRLQTVVWLHRPGQALPDFDLSPTRQVLRRVGGDFGLQPVAFDGRDDFRDRYHLLGRDPAALRQVFGPRVIAAVLAEPGWFIEGRGDEWLVYRLSERASPERLPAFVDQAIGLIERLAGR